MSLPIQASSKWKCLPEIHASRLSVSGSLRPKIGLVILSFSRASFPYATALKCVHLDGRVTNVSPARRTSRARPCRRAQPRVQSRPSSTVTPILKVLIQNQRDVFQWQHFIYYPKPVIIILRSRILDEAHDFVSRIHVVNKVKDEPHCCAVNLRAECLEHPRATLALNRMRARRNPKCATASLSRGVLEHRQRGHVPCAERSRESLTERVQVRRQAVGSQGNGGRSLARRGPERGGTGKRRRRRRRSAVLQVQFKTDE